MPVCLGKTLLGLSPDWLITNPAFKIAFSRGNVQHINGYFVKTFLSLSFVFYFPPQVRRSAGLSLI